MKAHGLNLDELVADLPVLVPALRAAEFFDITPRCLRDWVASERIRAVKTSPRRPGRVLIPRSEIRRLLGEMAR